MNESLQERPTRIFGGRAVYDDSGELLGIAFDPPPRQYPNHDLGIIVQRNTMYRDLAFIRFGDLPLIDQLIELRPELLYYFEFNIPDPVPAYYPDWFRELLDSPNSPAVTTPQPDEEPPFWAKGPAGGSRRSDLSSGKHKDQVRRTPRSR